MFCAFSLSFQIPTDSLPPKTFSETLELCFLWLQPSHICTLFLEISSISLLKLRARALPKGRASLKPLSSGGYSFSHASLVPLAAFRILLFYLGEKDPIDVYAIGSLWKIKIQPCFWLLSMLTYLSYMENNFSKRNL